MGSCTAIRPALLLAIVLTACAPGPVQTEVPPEPVQTEVPAEPVETEVPADPVQTEAPPAPSSSVSSTPDPTTTGDEEPVAWEDLPPERRSVDVEDTPPDILATLSPLVIFVEVPAEWSDWAVTFCGQSELGALGCTLASSGDNWFPVLVDPNQGFDLVLRDAKGSFGSETPVLVRVTPELVAAGLEDGNALHFAPSRRYEDLAELAAQPSGSAYRVRVDDHDALVNELTGG